MALWRGLDTGSSRGADIGAGRGAQAGAARIGRFRHLHGVCQRRVQGRAQACGADGQAVRVASEGRHDGHGKFDFEIDSHERGRTHISSLLCLSPATGQSKARSSRPEEREQTPQDAALGVTRDRRAARMARMWVMTEWTHTTGLYFANCIVFYVYPAPPTGSERDAVIRRSCYRNTRHNQDSVDW